MYVTKMMATVAIAGVISCPALGLSAASVANAMPNSVVAVVGPGATLPQDDDWWWGDDDHGHDHGWGGPWWGPGYWWWGSGPWWGHGHGHWH